MTITTWLYQTDGEKAPMPQRSSSDSGKLFMVLKRLHGYGTTISMPFYYPVHSHIPQPVPTSISAAASLWYFHMSMISPCHIRRLLPMPWSKSKRISQRSTRSWTWAEHTNSAASKPTTMIPKSDLVGRPISPQSSDNLAWSIHTVPELLSIQMISLTWFRIPGRWNWNRKIPQTMKQWWGHYCTQHLQLGHISRMWSLLFLITICRN